MEQALGCRTKYHFGISNGSSNAVWRKYEALGKCAKATCA